MTEHEMIRYMVDALNPLGLRHSPHESAFNLPLPSDIRAASQIEWEPVPEELYTPTNFMDTPPMFGSRYPIVVFNSYLWIYVHDGYESSYFKFTPA